MCFEPLTSRQMLATMRVQADDALSRPIRHGEKKAMARDIVDLHGPMSMKIM
jgi:hypothetical protein